MSRLEVFKSIPVASHTDFDGWLRAHAGSEREVVVAIYKQASGRQTITLAALQEAALCHGWVDTQTKRIDGERYAIRFVARRPGSSWSANTRRMARSVGARTHDARWLYDAAG